MHIVDLVYYWARTIPLHPAVIEPEGVITYASLAHAIELSAEHFGRNILDRSKPVAVSIPTASKMLVAILGLLRARFDVVVASRAELKHLASVNADTLICEHDGARLEGGDNIVFENSWLMAGTAADKQPKPPPQSRTTGGNIMCFTSGTTGRPKVVVCPPRSWQQRVLFPLNSVYSEYKRMLVVPGLSTSWGISRVYEALHFGRTVCLAPPSAAMLAMAGTYEADTMLVSPQQALMLADLQEKVTHYSLPALKTVQLGASAITRDGILRIKKHLCREVVIIYGSTEAGVVAAAPYDMMADVPGAVGFILPGVDVEIVDDLDRLLPAGREGFVRVRSPVLFENLAAAQTPPGWFYPGDIGWINPNGLLCIVGRSTDVLNRGGEKFSITDFENFLLSCPGVKDAGVCTVMGHSGREEAWIGLVIQPSADLGALRQAVEANTSFGTNYDKIFVVEAIPRGTLGKVQRAELKKMLFAISGEAPLPDVANPTNDVPPTV
jgi:acyl-coenzyme A synthetase/AMP-(fatty) acid ligase